MTMNRTHLIHLAEREYRREARAPAPKPVRKSFKGWRLNIAKYGQGWDRKRGAAMRLIGVLLNEDSAALEARVAL